MLIGLPIFASIYASDLLEEKGKGRAKEPRYLRRLHWRGLNIQPVRQPTYLGSNIFMRAEKNSPYQVDALLAYWLSYFVFSSPLEDGLNNFFFPWRFCWLRGKDSHWCRGIWVPISTKNVVWPVGRHDVVSYVDADSLQLFLLQRCRALSLCPTSSRHSSPK